MAIRILKLMIYFYLLCRFNSSYTICPDGKSACYDGYQCCLADLGYTCCPFNTRCCDGGYFCCTRFNNPKFSAFESLPKSKAEKSEDSIVGNDLDKNNLKYLIE